MVESNYKHQTKADQQDNKTSKPVSAAVDYINQPPHYKTHPMECIDEMLVAMGEKAVFYFCVCNAWKYRYRAGSKGSVKDDLAKSDWYMRKAAEIKATRQYPGDLYDNGVS